MTGKRPPDYLLSISALLRTAGLDRVEIELADLEGSSGALRAWIDPMTERLIIERRETGSPPT